MFELTDEYIERIEYLEDGIREIIEELELENGITNLSRDLRVLVGKKEKNKVEDYEPPTLIQYGSYVEFK